VFAKGLRDQQAVERIAMKPGKIAHAPGVLGQNREDFEVRIGLKSPEEIVRNIQAALP